MGSEASRKPTGEPAREIKSLPKPRGTMELTVLNHLRLSDIPRKIVLQFLRKPHPTALLIKSISFERETWEFEDDSFRDIWVISGLHIRRRAQDRRYDPPRDEEYRNRACRPIVRLEPSDGETWYIDCHYNDTNGESHRTSIIQSEKRSRLWNQLRFDLGLPWRICP